MNIETITKNLNEDFIRRALLKSPDLILWLENPSEEMKELIVNDDPYNIIHIGSPSEKLQLLAVKLNPFSIQYIKNPTENVKLVAVKLSYKVIFYIKDPSEELYQEALKLNPNLNIPDKFKKIKNEVDIINDLSLIDLIELFFKKLFNKGK